MKLTEFEFGNKKYLHSPDLRSWDDWMSEQENGLYLLPERRLYEIPHDLLIPLPGIFAGFRSTDGSFGSRGSIAYLWSSSQYDSSIAWYRLLYYSDAQVRRNYYYDKAYGFSAIYKKQSIQDTLIKKGMGIYIF